MNIEAPYIASTPPKAHRPIVAAFDFNLISKLN